MYLHPWIMCEPLDTKVVLLVKMDGNCIFTRDLVLAMPSAEAEEESVASQWARTFKKVQAKKLVKSNK